MKAFLDTNVVMDFFGYRKYYKEARLIMEAALQGGIDAYMSVGSMYTLSYLLSIDLKLKGIHEPDKTEAIREMLSELLSKYIFAIELSHQKMEYALKDLSFHDLEDSYQYYCAIENNCDAIVTINIKHFKGDHKKQIPIYTPQEFVERFIKQEETTNQ